MDAKSLIELAMDGLSGMNGGRRVVLWVDEAMIHVNLDGDHQFLPVMNIEGDNGYYRFPDSIRDQVSGYFGALIGPARERVAEMNTERGIAPAEARRIVMDTMVRGRHE